MFLSYDSPQRFAAWRSGGIRSTKLSTKLQGLLKELHFNLPLYPPLRQTAVTCWCSVVFLCTLLSVLSFSVIVCRVVRLHIFFQKGRRFFLIQFCLRGKGRRSFARFGLCLGLCSLQMCLHQCVGYFSLYFSLIIFCKSLGLNETAHFHFPNPPCSLTALHHSLR
jgi:hypothetical protein